MKKWVLAGLCLASGAMMVLPGSRKLCEFTRAVLVPVSDITMAVPGTIRERIDEMARDPAERRDEQVESLRRFIVSQQEIIRAQRRQIDGLAGWRSKLKGFRCKLIEARIVSSEAVTLRNRRLVNAGRDRGTAPGDLVTTRRLLHEIDVALPEALTVLGRNFVVGRIIDSAAFSATLQLVTDPGFEMPAALWRLVGPGQKRSLWVPDESTGRRKVMMSHDGKTPGYHAVGDAILVQAQGDGRQIV
ncbi:hypothetical protein LCGC14_1872150, partial [marine sediment metagenome]